MQDHNATRHPMRRLLSNRRGLLAGAAALLGAGLAKLGGPERAEAAHTASDRTTLHANVTNETTSITRIVGAPSGSPTILVRRFHSG